MIALVMEDYETTDDNDASTMVQSLLKLCEKSVSPDDTPDISQVKTIFCTSKIYTFILANSRTFYELDMFLK